MASSEAGDKPWYTDQKFNRFWEHYHSCFRWMSVQQRGIARFQQDDAAEAWKKWSVYAMQMYHMHRNQHQPAAPHFRQDHLCNNTPQQDTAHHNHHRGRSTSSRSNQKRKSSRPTSRQRTRKSKRQNTTAESIIAITSQDDDAFNLEADDAFETVDEEDFLCEIPFSDDLLAFLAQSAKHRRQRDRQKRLAEKLEKENDYGEDFDKSYRATSKAPKERPGQRRTAEMKMLYGKGAAMIHGMETAIQLTFDRNCDLKQPKHWPNLPLNLKFN